MRCLSTAELLTIWERGVPLLSIERALLLLNSAYSELSAAEISDLSIGQRDALILTLRERTFGSQFTSVISCPRCNTMLDLQFSVADVRADLPTTTTITFTFNDHSILVRLPTSRDVLAAMQTDDPLSALVRRCVADSEFEYDADWIHHCSQALVHADPQADVELNLICPECELAWTATFDIVNFFWHEVERWSRHIFNDVHLLALHYGWSEADILALSPRRRQLYLEMVQ